jgi:FdhD protein
MSSLPLPRLTHARLPLTRELCAVNEFGELQRVWIPVERALTVYIDKRELVTLMTLGALPELLVLGYLRNQRLIADVHEVESITVDWEVGAAAVKTRDGIADIEARTASKVVTTGCGQGSVFGNLMADVDQLVLAPATLTQEQLYAIINTIRVQDSTYKTSGSVHGCALFRGDEMLIFVEDVGRHNAIDTIAGWMWMQDEACAPSAAVVSGKAGTAGADKVFYTTGRLTSEMVIKAAQMGIPIVVSRSGITQMGLEVAQRLDLCAIGRATNKRFLCFSGAQRLQLQPELAGAKLRVVA